MRQASEGSTQSGTPSSSVFSGLPPFLRRSPGRFPSIMDAPRLLGCHQQELPTHYDLVINTDQIVPEQAVNLIVAAAG